MEHQLPLVSIVVPVYRARDYLPACLDSVLGQAFPGWECILVDDGSPDGSGAVCDGYAAKDPRFVPLHKENAGVSAARNDGIERARGRYLVFLDADDALAPCALALALAAAEQHPGDLVCWRRIRQRGQLAPADFCPPGGVPQTVYGSPQSRVYMTTVDGHAVTNKLFETNLVRQAGVRFDPALARAEDYVFGGEYLDAFFAARPGAAIRQLEAPLYFWRQNPASVSNQLLKGDRRGSWGKRCPRTFSTVGRCRSCWRC